MCNNTDLLSIIGLIKKVVWLLQIFIPLGLLAFGTVDLGKAVIAGDEKEIKSATSLLFKRFVAALAVYLLFTLVSYVTGWVGGSEWKTCWNAASKNTSINPIG